VPARVLIVDDEPAVADLIEAVLVGEGYTVAIARDGVQGKIKLDMTITSHYQYQL